MSKPSFTEKLKRSMAARNLSFKSITAMVIFGVIILVFVLFSGTHGQLGAAGAGYAARVNNVYISLKDLDAETARVERSFGQMFGQLGGAQRSFITNQALQSLIANELISQYSEKASIYATDHEVKEVIVTELPYFQQDGRFRRELYEQILVANQLTPKDFEQKIRTDRKMMRLRGLFENSASPLNLEVAKQKELGETQLNFAFVRLDKPKVVEAMAISEADVNSKLQDAEFKKRVADEFTANPDRYDVPEEVNAAHILIKVDPTKPSGEADALKSIRDLKTRAEKEDFGKLAAQYSEDTGSKVKQGQLGSFARGKMVPEFDEVAFTLQPGQISEPVKTQFGYHLIKVNSKTPARKAELANFERQIAKRLIAEERFDQAVTKLEEKVNAKDMAGINEVLKSMGQTWQETGFVDLSTDFIPSLASRDATLAAFTLTAENPLSKVIRDGTSKYVVQYKAKNQKAAAQPVDPSALARERATDRMGQWLQDVQKKARIDRNPAVGAANAGQSLGF